LPKFSASDNYKRNFSESQLTTFTSFVNILSLGSVYNVFLYDIFATINYTTVTGGNSYAAYLYTSTPFTPSTVFAKPLNS
jgi:hypothetical protein